MRIIHWEVPLILYPEAADRLRILLEASTNRDATGVQAAFERLKDMPGFPRHMTPQDTVHIHPKGATIMVAPRGVNNVN